MDATKYDLFISHSSEDKEFVRDLVHRFEQVGVSCWLDEDAIDAGGSIVEGIFEGIRSSRKVLLVYSPNFFSATWGKKEYRSSLMKDPENKKRKLLPLMWKPTEIPEDLQELRYLDATSPTGLEKSIRNILENLMVDAPETERVYISYTHDSEEHKQWVAALHRKLRHDGIDVRFDFDFMRPGRNVWQDIEKYISRSTCVLLIGTPSYRVKATENISGLFREYGLLVDKFNESDEFRMIPVLRSGDWLESFPCNVCDNFGIRMDTKEEEITGYATLLRTLLNLDARLDNDAEQETDDQLPAHPESKVE